MKNRLQDLLQLLLLVGLLSSMSTSLQSQAFDFFYPGPNTFYLDGACEATFDFDGFPPIVSSNVGANIVPPTGVDMALTGYDLGAIISGEQTVTVGYIAADDMSNQDTFFFDISFVDTIAPVFIDPTPPNLSIDCAGDFPPPFARTAVENCGPSPIIATSQDSPAPPNNNCTAPVVITRTWTATDAAGNTTVSTQLITIGVDQQPPTIGTLPSDGTFSCDFADFATWLNTQRNTILATASDNCNILTLTDNAPASFTNPCGSVTVNFTLSDGCGLSANASATYTLIDTVPPVLSGIPADITISCDDPLPTPPFVSATDNCDPNALVPVLTQSDDQTSDGICMDNTYTITRTWTVMDGCGNSSSASQLIHVVDQQAPTFTLPPDATVSCDVSADPPVTGFLSNVDDNCSLLTIESFTDVDTSALDCPQNTQITREWTVTDACGNVAVDTQLIFLIDTVPPTFTPPADTAIIDCDMVDNTTLTGEPTDFFDKCGGAASFFYTDSAYNFICTNNYSISRKWFVEDECGNIDSSFVQIVIVQDTTAPVITTPAQPLTVACTTDNEAENSFNGWLSINGFAMAVDNCSDPGTITWAAYNTGTTDPAVLPATDCFGGTVGIYRTQTVDFVAIDECGNMSLSTATFNVIDNSPPTISACPTDMVLPTDPGECFAILTLDPPIVAEDCGVTELNLNYDQTLPVTAPGMNQDLPVSPLTFNFSVEPPPVKAVGNVTITITLNGTDSETTSEYFNILGDDGSNLGQTELVPAQCDTSVTTITIPANLYNLWAQDGFISITLQPNVPPGLPGEFAINDVCPNNNAVVEIDYEATTPDGIRFEYSIDNGPRILVDPVEPIIDTFQVGTRLITYFVADCAGNESTCDFEITVEDQEPPVLTCPADFSVEVDPEECQATVDIPLLVDLTDNCGATTNITQTQPSNPSDAFITFTQNPNFGEFLADDKIFVFSGISGTAVGDVTIIITLQGDIENATEYFTILDQNSTVIGTTQIGQPNVTPGDCNTPSIATFTISAAQFNTLAADGFLVIIADSFEDFPVPPPMSAMGINPCIPGNVQNNGDNDGLSSITATLSYETYETTYFATGATEIENTTISGSVASPTHVLNQGVTTFHYIVEDFAGNIDTCDFNITVEDNEDPVALCGATNVTIDPSGLSSDMIEPSDIDLGSFDNCEIVSMNVTANPITCDMIGDTMSVVLTVTDASGNDASCQTFVQIIGEQPMPTYSIGPCGNDSLYLFANPPDVQGGINPWQFSWTSSTGFVSSQENPIIPNASGDDAGSYTVTIQGLTGCVASGEVQVAIEDLPITPTIDFQDNAICSFDDIVMTTDPVPGGSTIYQWYSGQAPSGTLIATTAVPSYTVNGPFMEGDSCYYVVAVRDGCASSPSASKCVEITGQPVALTNDDIIDICEGGTVELGTPVSGPGITYSWTGPNFVSNLQIPAPITNITLLQDGLYSLVISKNGCESEPAFTVINVLDAPNQPLVTNTTTAQNPACVGDTVTLFANITNADSYEWTSPFFDTFVTNVSQLVLEDITTMQEGNWTVVAFYNICASPQSDGSFIFVEELPNASFSVNSPVCSNEDLILDATTIPGAVYEWELPSGSILQGEVVTVSPPQAGQYELTVTSAQGCKNTDSETVVVNQAPVVTGISNNAPTCPEGPTDILLTATIFPPDDGSYEYLWQGDGFMSTDSIGIIPGATANDNGPYVLTVTNSFECSSNQLTTTVDMGEILQTPSTPALGEPNPYCEGDNVELTTVDVYNGMIETYYWHLPNGQGVITTPNPSLELDNLTLNNTGNYFVVVEVDGCFTDTSAVRFVQVNPIPVAEAFSNSPVCEGDVIQLSTDCQAGNVQYLWNGSDFNSTICSPIIPNATEDNAGTYELTVTVNGCSSSTVFTNVFVNEVPETPIINSSGDICIDDPDAQLVLTISTGSATQGASYIWLNQNMDTIAPVGPALVAVITDFSGYSPGLNTFFVQAIKGGCASDFSIPVTINFSQTPNQNADAGPDLQICDGQAAEMEAVAPQVGTGTWTLIDGNPTGVAITNPNDPGTTITGLQLGETYLFEWALSNGPCDEYSADVVEVFVGLLEQADAGEMIDTCAVTSVKLNPVLPSVGMGMWCQPEAQEQLGVIILEPNNPNTTVGGLVPGNDYIFTWKLPDMGCGESTDEVIVRVIDDFVYAGEDFEDCGDGCTELDAIPPEVGQGQWSSPNGAINFSDVNDPMATACGLEAGINKLVWVSNQGICGDDGADTLQVFYQLNPIAENDVVQVPFAGEAFFQPDSNDFKPVDYFIEFSSDPINGVITALPGGIYSYEANINFVGVEEVTYLICSELCECSEGIIRFEVGQAARCTVPNIITPNGDGINDAFIIPCLANDQKYPENEVAIFNQWGDEVFREAPYTNSWEGTYDGESLPSGTYFYIILFGEDEDPQTGFLVIQQ